MTTASMYPLPGSLLHVHACIPLVRVPAIRWVDHHACKLFPSLRNFPNHCMGDLIITVTNNGTHTIVTFIAMYTWVHVCAGADNGLHSCLCYT